MHGTMVRRCGAFLAAAGAALAGCGGVGPALLRNGRPAYNDAIVATNNEQILGMIVRMRYREPAGLLAVVSVTANVRVQASAGSEVGFGPESNYSGNLVPLTVGALYEENPTISYAPVQGQEYLRQLLSPIPLDLAVLVLNAAGNSPGTMSLLLESINGVDNPEFLMDSGVDAGRFEEIAEVFASLFRRGGLIWARRPGEAGEAASFVMFLRGEGEEHARLTLRLHELLGMAPPEDPGAFITIPVRLAVGPLGGSSIELTTRSVWGLFQIAAASVDVPEEHLESGLATRLPATGPVVGQIRIRRSASRPPSALVAVQHHGWWFSIDGTDGESKQTFQVIQAVMTASIADAAGANAARPVLTVPVSR